MTTNTYFADFYRPLVAQLRQSELVPVGRGGWRGRWRSFQTGYPGAIYVTEVTDGTVSVFLRLHGDEYQRVYEALTRHQAEIDDALSGSAEWVEVEGVSSVSLEMAADHPDLDTDPEAVRQWMADNILRLRGVVQPHLEQIMEELDIAPDRA